METLKMLFAINPNYYIVGFIFVFYTMEQLLVTPFKFDNRPKHLLNNVLFQIVYLFINFFYASLLVFCINWLNDNQIGLFYLVKMPYWLKLMIGVALFDFTTYWFHRMGHVVPLFWRLHRVHHSDTTMDSSSYFRSHPIEPFVNFGIGNMVASAIFGLDLTTFGLYSFIVLPFLIVQHINLKTPDWVDTTLGKVFMTPNLHKIHHEQDQFHTDSNFADIFVLWDRLFGTYTYKPLKEIKLGLKKFNTDEKQSFWYLMKSPFISIKRNVSDQ